MLVLKSELGYYAGWKTWTPNQWQALKYNNETVNDAIKYFRDKGLNVTAVSC